MGGRLILRVGKTVRRPSLHSRACKLYQFLSEEVALFETRIAKTMEPYAGQTELLITILGLDLKAFPDADRCCSWPGMVRGENESAGKKKSNKCRKGNKTLRRVQTQAARAASHCKKGTCAPSSTVSSPGAAGRKLSSPPAIRF